MLPNSLDVVDFAKARMAEIGLLKKDIDDAKYRGARRVFQTLPKSMRRRAASFNIKRLPARLRMKAVEEMKKDPDSIQKKIQKPSCRRRQRRTKNIQEMSEKRQGNKRWLETHIWHAKRSKMVDIWGYRLALHPNEKCLRSSFKASKTGTTIHDASYLQVFEISGKTSQINDLIQTVALECAGKSTFEFNLYSCSSLRLICPAKGMIATFEENSIFWILIHPAAATDAFENLKTIATSFLVNVSDVTTEISIFEFSGSRTKEAIGKVAQSIEKSTIDEALSHHLVNDPRLSFPPKDEDKIADLSISVDLRFRKSLWDQNFRKLSVEKMISEKDLNAIREKQMIPGGPIKAEHEPIPIIVADFAHSVLFLMPKGWARPFWRSFTFAGAKVSGLEQVKRNAQELGIPCFPYDFPGTSAYIQHVEATAILLQEEHEKKPKAKRINYENLGITSPFKPAFSPDSWIMPSKVLEAFLTEANVGESFEVEWSRIRADVPLNASTAVILGEIIYNGRGTPEYNSIIYHESDDVIMGYLTTGFFSLSKGCGAGLGTCSVSLIAPSLKADSPLEDQIVPVRIRNTNSKELRPASFRPFRIV